MKNKIFALLFILYGNTVLAQDSLKKSNPIIYGEAGIGVPLAGISGIQFNFALNYQLKKAYSPFDTRR